MQSAQRQGYRVHDSGFESRHDQHIFCPKRLDQILGPMQLPIKRISEALRPVVMWPGREAVQSRSSIIEIKKD
jgi:hypothetical protein